MTDHRQIQHAAIGWVRLEAYGAAALLFGAMGGLILWLRPAFIWESLGPIASSALALGLFMIAALCLLIAINKVREPLYRKASGRWRNYANELEPLVIYLREAGVEF